MKTRRVLEKAAGGVLFINQAKKKVSQAGKNNTATKTEKMDMESVPKVEEGDSQVLARQMIGRVTRKAPKKERGYILVPMWSEDEINATGKAQGG